MYINNQAIFTSREEFAKTAKNEVKNLVPSVKFIDWVGDGVGLVEFQSSFKDISGLIRSTPPIFIRHINPVQAVIDINTDSTTAQHRLSEKQYINRITQNIKPIIEKIDKDKTFSVQTRIFGNTIHKTQEQNHIPNKYDINESVSSFVMELTGASLNVKEPQQVLSVVCLNDKVFIGLSDVEDNISDWAGGEKRLAKDKEQISRAEFKLIEAIDIFKLDIPYKKSALDLGASPGGWTRVLRKEYNARVTALDPADIDPSLVTDKKVSHIRKTAQKFFKTNDKHFDVIVNDMRIDYNISAEIMKEASHYLKPGGIGVMTLKLPKKKVETAIRNTLKELGKYYRIIGARQLFHNRHEITIAFCSKV